MNSRPIVGLGTAAFLPGYAPGSANAISIDLVKAAVDAGVRYVDTAAAYGDSEAALGTLASLLSAHEVRVCTKVAISPPASVAALDRLVEQSLSRLRLPSVDTLLLHSAAPEVLRDHAVGDAMSAVKACGRTRRTGASTYGASAAREALALDYCDTIQVELSILNQELVDVIARLEPGRQAVVRSVFCKGLLTTRRAHVAVPASVAGRLAAIDALAADIGLSTPQLAIRFALDQVGVDVVLVGVTSVSELDDALAAEQAPPLSTDVMAALRAMDARDTDWSHPERWATGARR